MSYKNIILPILSLAVLTGCTTKTVYVDRYIVTTQPFEYNRSMLQSQLKAKTVYEWMDVNPKSKDFPPEKHVLDQALVKGFGKSVESNNRCVAITLSLMDSIDKYNDTLAKLERKQNEGNK